MIGIYIASGAIAAHVVNPWVDSDLPDHARRAQQQEFYYQQLKLHIDWIITRFELGIKTNNAELAWKFAMQEARDGFTWTSQSVFRRLMDHQHVDYVANMHALETIVRMRIKRAMKNKNKGVIPQGPKYPGLSPNDDVRVCLFIVRPGRNLEEDLVSRHRPFVSFDFR